MKLTILFSVFVLSVAVPSGCVDYPVTGISVDPVIQPATTTHRAEHIGEIMRLCAEKVRQMVPERNPELENSLFTRCLLVNDAVI